MKKYARIIEEHNYILIEKNLKEMKNIMLILIYLQTLLDDYKIDEEKKKGE